MKVNIYDSMAQAIAGSAVVVAFISQRYQVRVSLHARWPGCDSSAIRRLNSPAVATQDSENCKLELTLAKQNKIPIVLVKMQENWTAKEWLGVVTAGLLYTPMHDQATMQQNLQTVVDQIKAAVPTNSSSAGAVKSPRAAASMATNLESQEMLSLRGELDSLRQDLAKAVTQRSGGHEGEEETGSVLAPIPGEVPALSLNLRPTPDMEKLKSMLMAEDVGDSTTALTSERSKVGALGMGGIGKTVTAS
eukprot:COSAG06_NODE_4620_length_4092_cov_389.018373_3_plen_248_part_00